MRTADRGSTMGLSPDNGFDDMEVMGDFDEAASVLGTEGIGGVGGSSTGKSFRELCYKAEKWVIVK